MNTNRKVSLDTQKINTFDKFAKAFYVFGRFMDMDATLWEALSGTIRVSADNELLEEWCEATQYYNENK